jgi:hypothetical protein
MGKSKQSPLLTTTRPATTFVHLTGDIDTSENRDTAPNAIANHGCEGTDTIVLAPVIYEGEDEDRLPGKRKSQRGPRFSPRRRGDEGCKPSIRLILRERYGTYHVYSSPTAALSNDSTDVLFQVSSMPTNPKFPCEVRTFLPDTYTR